MAVLRSPVASLRAREPGEVLARLIDAERFAADGLIVAGYVGYAAGVDPSLSARRDAGFLVALDVFENADRVEHLPPVGPVRLPKWTADITESAYRERVETTRDHIGAGNVYQVNFTYRLHAEITDPWAWFCAVLEPDIPRNATYFDDGERVVVCLSPELFFYKQNGIIISKPMKGTASPDSDPVALRESVKDRAENLMITDMIRNDLGRIARLGSVTVPAMFEVERHPTVLQMTSTVAAETDATAAQVFAALHPCASITGAPKIAAMRLISDLEDSPRGIYCGAIGFMRGDVQDWGVAIRTAVVDRDGAATYGVGSGITWDSDPQAEWAECQQKCLVLAGQPWSLLETMPNNPAVWPDHLARLARSSHALGIPFVAPALGRYEGVDALRITLSPEGDLRIQPFVAQPLPDPLCIAFAPGWLKSDDPWRKYKTTNRRVYDDAIAAFPNADEVLLGNERGEWVEFCRGNLLYRLGENWFTPPLSSGALPGIARARGLADGQWTERTLLVSEFVDEWQFVNSLRGRRSVSIA